MAKSKKDKASKKALSKGDLYTQEAISNFFTHFGRRPDNDEVLRKAGITRHRLSVLLDDDEIAQAVEGPIHDDAQPAGLAHWITGTTLRASIVLRTLSES